MKGYNKPKKMETGICFICKKECDPFAYCHLECARAFVAEKDRKIQEARYISD
jgi:hypothetical protein